MLWSFHIYCSIQGSESWLVSFDECQILGRQGVIQSQHGNKFFSVSVSGLFHISVTYVPVIIQGKPVRVREASKKKKLHILRQCLNDGGEGSSKT